MPVIKHSSSNRLLKDAVVLDLGDLNRQAQRIIDDARAEAARLLSDAKLETRRLIESAAETGHAQGMERGMAEGREIGAAEAREEVLTELKPRFEQLAAAWGEALARWEDERGEMLLAARQDVLALALELGHKIVFRILEVDESIIEDQLAEALSLLVRPTAATVRISPEDRPLVEAVLPEVLARLGAGHHASIVEEPEMTRGGCVVAVVGGEIDAQVETQLARIVDALLPSPRHAANAEAESGGTAAA